MLLLAIPVLVSVIVVLAGFFSLFIPTSQPQPLPRAIAMPVASAPTPRVTARRASATPVPARVASPAPVTRIAATVRRHARAVPILVQRAPSCSDEEQTIVFARAAR